MRVAAKLGETDPRWYEFPRDMMNNECKAWKSLLNVVDYQQQKLRVKFNIVNGN